MTDRSVYFIEAEGFGRVKIGLARDPRSRMKDLQTASPAKLRLLAILSTDDAAACEGWLHRRFKAQRVQGEWFRSNPTLRRLIRSLAGWPMTALFRDRAMRSPALSITPTPDCDTRILAKHFWNAADAVGLVEYVDDDCPETHREAR